MSSTLLLVRWRSSIQRHSSFWSYLQECHPTLANAFDVSTTSDEMAAGKVETKNFANAR